MKIRLNLATEPAENGRRFAFAATVAGSLAVLALLLLATRAYYVSRQARQQRAELTALHNEIDQLNGQRAELQAYFNQPDVQKVRERAAFLNGLITERSFPWTRVFMDLENILPAGVRIVQIGPKLVGGHIELKLTAGAISDDAKLKFLRTLESSRSFSHIELLSENRPEHVNDVDHVYIELVAWYAVS
jgi:Tfp pilus assembly protein PilN